MWRTSLGKEVTKKDYTSDIFDAGMYMIMGIAFLAFVLPAIPVIQSAQRYYQSMQYQGRTVSRMLEAIQTKRHEDFSPELVSTYFYNTGGYAVLISINGGGVGNEFLVYPKDTIYVNRLGADERIASIDYSADQPTLIRLIGEY